MLVHLLLIKRHGILSFDPSKILEAISIRKSQISKGSLSTDCTTRKLAFAAFAHFAPWRETEFLQGLIYGSLSGDESVLIPPMTQNAENSDRTRTKQLTPHPSRSGW
jgi:hypothetical protein